MTADRIEKLLEKADPLKTIVRISFKDRAAVHGRFIQTSDYKELSRKNLWRVVNEINIDSYDQSKNENLTRIFNGTAFTKLELKEQ